MIAQAMSVSSHTPKRFEYSKQMEFKFWVSSIQMNKQKVQENF